MLPAMRLRTRTIPIVLALGVLACGGSGNDGCPELDCENTIEVEYAPGLVGGPYDLAVRGDNGMLSGRCADPQALETEDNPPELSCTVNGFTIVGGPLANEIGTIWVSIFDAADGSTIVENHEVALVDDTPLDAVCQTCAERSGKVMGR